MQNWSRENVARGQYRLVFEICFATKKKYMLLSFRFVVENILPNRKSVQNSEKYSVFSNISDALATEL